MNANMEGIKAEMTQAQEDIESRRKTLLADQDGLYDPTDYNDRLLLGLKKTSKAGARPCSPIKI